MTRTISKDIDGLVMGVIATRLCTISQMCGQIKDLVQACQDGETDEEVGRLYTVIASKIGPSSLAPLIPFLRQHTLPRYHKIFSL